MDTLRLQQLSGLHPQRAILEQLKADREKVIAAYDQLINDTQQGKQLDEGLFTNLKATLATLGHLTGAGIRKVSDAAKKIGADIKEVYLDNKAKVELELLVKNIKKVITDFEGIEKDAATIIKRDPEVAKEMELFSTLLNKLLNTLSVRLEVSKNGGGKPEAGESNSEFNWWVVKNANNKIVFGPSSKPAADKKAVSLGDGFKVTDKKP